jgi:thiosulfate dehydrogenase
MPRILACQTKANMIRSPAALRCRVAALLLGVLGSAAAGADSTSDAIPEGPLGDAIRQGEHILTHTPQAVPEYNGSALNCTSCHMNGGRKPYASSWVGIWGVFPEYRSRNARVNLLEDRINDCFERSMNGRALPFDSLQMRAILAYFQWLSRGVPTGQDGLGRGFKRITAPRPPDRERGARIYAEKCALCHGKDGEGTYSQQGVTVYPPLWGPRSFNIGAGLARVNAAAAFVKANMPFGQDDTLTDQEAFDVADFFAHQPRPDFAGKERDWPKGDKPQDARY